MGGYPENKEKPLLSGIFQHLEVIPEAEDLLMVEEAAEPQAKLLLIMYFLRKIQQ